VPKDEVALTPVFSPSLSKAAHVHTCIVRWEGDGSIPIGHHWTCTSPYCNALERKCVAHGGDEPREE
jgi:hypothetical protein